MDDEKRDKKLINRVEILSEKTNRYRELLDMIEKYSYKVDRNRIRPFVTIRKQETGLYSKVYDVGTIDGEIELVEAAIVAESEPVRLKILKSLKRSLDTKKTILNHRIYCKENSELENLILSHEFEVENIEKFILSIEEEVYHEIPNTHDGGVAKLMALSIILEGSNEPEMHELSIKIKECLEVINK